LELGTVNSTDPWGERELKKNNNEVGQQRISWGTFLDLERRGCLELEIVNSMDPWGERELKKTIMRSAINGFHGGLFKNNRLKKKKIALRLCVCLS